MATNRTKTELLEALRSNATDVLERLRGLSEADLAAGRYESGWNGRQILAHTAAMEWTYPKLIDIAVEGKTGAARDAEVRRTKPDEAPKVPTRKMECGVDGYNERQVAKREGASIAELLEEFSTNREATIAAVEAADEALFAREIRSAGGLTGTLANVIYSVAVLHVRGHVSDIAGSG